MGALALVADKKEKPTKEPTPLGKALKSLREEKGLTQRELADAAGCEFQYVSGLETGNDQSKPSAHYIDKWAEKLGVPPNSLRDLAGHPRLITSQEQSERIILDYYEAASEESREIMRAVLKTIYEVDQKRVQEGKATPTADAVDELQASEWPGAKSSKKNDSKNAKGR